MLLKDARLSVSKAYIGIGIARTTRVAEINLKPIGYLAGGAGHRNRECREAMSPVGIQRSRNTHAFTVVEVLIAAAILLVALLAVAGTLPTGSTNVDEAGRISTAAALAQQTLEGVKNSSFPPTSGNCSIYNVNAPTSFTCSLAVSLSGATPNRLATITVTTTWRDSQRYGNVRLVTALAE